MIVKNIRNGNYYGIRETGRYNHEGKEFGLTIPDEGDFGKIIRRITQTELESKWRKQLQPGMKDLKRRSRGL